jgi:hypothetical protein
MNDLLDIKVDASKLANAPRDIARAWLRAGNRTIRKTTKTISTRALRELAAATRVGIGKLRKGKRAATKITRKGGADSGSVWIGTGSIKAGFLGRPRQTKDGASIRGINFPGSFVATVAAGRDKTYRGIFERASAGALTIQRRGGKTSSLRTKGRPSTSSPNLPIVDRRVEFSQAAAAVERTRGEIRQRLDVVLVQELNFELSKRGR